MISLVQHWLPDVLELLRSPVGALLFMPLYALWVTLLLPGVWASMLAGVLYGTPASIDAQTPGSSSVTQRA